MEIDINCCGILKIKITWNTNEYKKNEIFKVNYKFLNACSNETWNNFVKIYNNKKIKFIYNISIIN